MKYIDLTFPTPEHNLACDEALLDMCEEGYQHEILRFWEPWQYFIVLGYARKVGLDVNLQACLEQNIPILRRPSGGGTILQGPGCFNFSLVLKIENSKSLRNIAETNSFVIKRHKQALESIVDRSIEVEGLSDLACGTLKFSGSAQRRRRRFILFHGTFLLDFDISIIQKLLPLPRKQPAYRNNRPHQDFLTNLNLPSNVVKEALRRHWKAAEPLETVPSQKIDQLIEQKYKQAVWNFKY